MEVVEGEGFEPSKAEPADLQSDPFGHSGTPPQQARLRTNYVLSLIAQIIIQEFSIYASFILHFSKIIRN